jgi:hypothetical protein
MRAWQRFALCYIAEDGIFDGDNSCIHIVILAIFFIGWRWRLLLLHERLPVERTRRIELQPRLYALQVEQVVFVARKAYNERMRVYQSH